MVSSLLLGFLDGCQHLVTVSPNVVEEVMQNSAGALVLQPEQLQERTASISSALFSESGLLKLLMVAIDLMRRAQRFELISGLYSIVMPVLERNRKYVRLSAACADMKDCFDKILQYNANGKRRLGTYFRVGLYGNLFRELAGAEFIYKEPNVTPLSEMSLRLRALYSARFGADQVCLITDSNKVDTEKLDMSKAHIQITFVEPYFPPEEQATRLTYFEQNHNISWFIFETPFTKFGKARGLVSEQFKRRTMLRVEDQLCFPYVKKRLLVVERKREILEPIDVAIQEMSKKINEIRLVVYARPLDMVMLQMQLQGSISMQVNAGPMELASEFLDEKNHYVKDRVEVSRNLIDVPTNQNS